MAGLHSTPPQAVTKRAALGRSIRDLMQSFNKGAAANSEPGDFDGPTTHPVKDVDDGTQPATTGSRAAENSAQVKKEQGPAGVESVAKAPSQDSVQPNQGVHQSFTGEAPSIETSSAKPGKEDGDFEGPSSHPARTDNDALNGGKYAEFNKMLTRSASMANDMLASMLSPSDTPAAPAADVKAAAAAGTAAADATVAANLQQAALQKQADHAALSLVAETVQYAEALAEKSAAYLNGFFAELNASANARPEAAAPAAVVGQKKRASDGKPPAEEAGKKEEDDEASEEPDGDEAPAAPAADAAPAGEAPPADAAMPSMPVDPAAGGDVPVGPVPGADAAMAGMGGEPGMPGAVPGAEAGGGDMTQLLQQLSPEDLQMLLEVLQQEMPQAPVGGMKAASAGKTLTVAESAAKQAKRAAWRAYIREVSGIR